jgi:hypothetical protein
VDADLRAAKICLQLAGLVKDKKDNDDLAKVLGYTILRAKKPDPPAAPATGAPAAAAPAGASPPGSAKPSTAPGAGAPKPKPVMEEVGSVEAMRTAAKGNVELRDFLGYTAASRSMEGVPGVAPTPAPVATSPKAAAG